MATREKEFQGLTRAEIASRLVDKDGAWAMPLPADYFDLYEPETYKEMKSRALAKVKKVFHA